MARASGFTCDNCGKFEIGGNSTPSVLAPPSGWFKVVPTKTVVNQTADVKGGQDADAGRLDFCSAVCLAQHGARRVMEEAGTKTFSFALNGSRGPSTFRKPRGTYKKKGKEVTADG